MMSTETQKAGLTKKQRDIVSHFLDLFTDVERALKKRLGLPSDDKTFVKLLIKDYETKNPNLPPTCDARTVKRR